MSAWRGAGRGERGSSAKREWMGWPGQEARGTVWERGKGVPRFAGGVGGAVSALIGT